MPPETLRRPVPWRTIWAVIAAGIVTVLGVRMLQLLTRPLTLLVVATFFAIVLNPPVDYLDRKLPGKRVLSALVVFLIGLLLIAAMLFTFIRPIVQQSQEFVDNFPEYVNDAEAGRGPLGGLVERFGLDERIEENQDRLGEIREEIGGRALGILGGIASTVFDVLTILVLTFLMLLEGPRILATGLKALDLERADRFRLVASDASKAITGYVAGNLAISLIAGVVSFIALSLIGVPFAGVLALWVAFADLIPLVGATLGAVPALAVAFLDSPRTGLFTLIFFIVYQQFENQVLQITIMSRTVKLNPLAVLVSVLLGVELFGILGALLAIPTAGVIQVIVRDIYDERTGRLKPEPTLGPDEVPISETYGSTAEGTDEARNDGAGTDTHEEEHP